MAGGLLLQTGPERKDVPINAAQDNRKGKDELARCSRGQLQALPDLNIIASDALPAADTGDMARTGVSQ